MAIASRPSCRRMRKASRGAVRPGGVIAILGAARAGSAWGGGDSLWGTKCLPLLPSPLLPPWNCALPMPSSHWPLPSPLAFFVLPSPLAFF
eukprot:7379794-Prymnesium_polylepis.1